jgi:hypothetical protein
MMQRQVAVAELKSKDFRGWGGKPRQDIACRTGKSLPRRLPFCARAR